MAVTRILVVRLGAMGDIIHALPAVTSLRSSFPGVRISWAVHPKWRELLEGGGAADELILVDRRSYSGVRTAAAALRRDEFDFAVDFQGLIQSALVARAARSGAVFGFHRDIVREKPASLFYTQTLLSRAAHVVDRNLALAAAAGATRRVLECPLPPGRPEGSLPQGPFVLAAPFAGWPSKQWPLEYYAEVAAKLPVPLVLNGAPSQESKLRAVAGARTHISSVSGLIDATRRAAAVIGVDSGPLHLAAALGVPGAAIFGPTDPRRNGPYSPAIRTLRSGDAVTTYKRGREIDKSMRDISPGQVLAVIMDML
jgi:heptosyltransferase-1